MKRLIVLFSILFLMGCSDQKGVMAEGGTANTGKAESESSELTAEQKEKLFVTDTLKKMTVEQKIGQLLMCDFRKDEKEIPVTQINESVEQALKEYHIGGIILFAENIDTAKQTKELTTDLQSAAEMPLLIGVDEEGGWVSRLHKSGKLEVNNIPPAAEIGKTGDKNQAYDAGVKIGEDLKKLGINVNFAPVADIYTNTENTVIGDRAFGTNAETTAPMVAAFVEGLQGTGISGSAKHFPGHGDTKADSHDGTVFAEADMKRLEAVEFVPFESAIKAGVHMIMVAHIKTPNATTDGLPASLSKEMITGVIREKMGFQGVIITDAMDMKAIVDEFGSGEAAVLAVIAGVDIVLMPSDYKEAYNCILQAVEEGRISEEELNDRASKILSLKYKKGLFADTSL